MALPALQSAIERFEAAPPAPSIANALSQAPEDPWNAIAHQVQAYANKIAQWRSGILLLQRHMWTDFTDLAKLVNEEKLQSLLQSIESFIEVVDASLTDNKKALRQSELDIARTISELKRSSPTNAKFGRKQLQALFEAEKGAYEVRSGFYYFLLSLRAEVDPESKGGPTFDDPAALETYMREQIKT